MEINKLLVWAKSVKSESKEKRAKYDPKRLPKIDNYIDMTIARCEYIQKETMKMQKFMDDIQDALTKLSSYGVSVPTEPKTAAKVQENPLLP